MLAATLLAAMSTAQGSATGYSPTSATHGRSRHLHLDNSFGMTATDSSEYMKQFAEMNEWYCGQEEHKESTLCVAYKMRDASPDERQEYRKKFKARMLEERQLGRTMPAHGSRGPSSQREDMYKAWCALEAQADTVLCTRKAAQQAAREKLTRAEASKDTRFGGFFRGEATAKEPAVKTPSSKVTSKPAASEATPEEKAPEGKTFEVGGAAKDFFRRAGDGKELTPEQAKALKAYAEEKEARVAARNEAHAEQLRLLVRGATHSDKSARETRRRLSEWKEMVSSYCTAERMEEAPCMGTLEREALRSSSPEARKLAREYKAKYAQISSTDRLRHTERMFEYWCNDPSHDRDATGVCLSWKHRRDRNLTSAAESRLEGLHELQEAKEEERKRLAAAGGKASPTEEAKAEAPKTRSSPRTRRQVANLAFRQEMDEVHEWYCTKTKPEVEDTMVCVEWRRKLTTNSRAERTRLEAIRRLEMAKLDSARAAARTEHEKLRKAGSMHPSKDETPMLNEYNELKEHGRAAFNEMRRAWCEEGDGKGKSDDESPVCARWRVEGQKTEL